MLDRVIARSRLVQLIDDPRHDWQIIGPVKERDHYFYRPVHRAAALDLDFTYCAYSPKASLLPPSETLFTFDRADGSFRTRPHYDERRRILVGVHPCDVNAIRLLDRVFSHGYRDEHYLCRRQRTFIVGIDCAVPCADGVFCGDMKANEASSGFDLMCYPLAQEGGDVTYGVVFGTPAGRELVVYARVGRPPGVDDERRLERYRVDKARTFPRMIPSDVDALPGLLERSYDSLLWEATARRCYSCGSCNLSCPTCYCFNTYDPPELTLDHGERRREWDGCQLRDFALVAGGHNFRPAAASRLRHRIYRKGKWIYEREGIPGCVGCARCDRACTARINSVEIYNQLAEEF